MTLIVISGYLLSVVSSIDLSSLLFINYAIWDSLEHYKEAINKLLFSSETHTSPLLKYDDSSLVISPHLFKKVDIQGI